MWDFLKNYCKALFVISTLAPFFGLPFVGLSSLASACFGWPLIGWWVWFAAVAGVLWLIITVRSLLKLGVSLSDRLLYSIDIWLL